MVPNLNTDEWLFIKRSCLTCHNSMAQTRILRCVTRPKYLIRMPMHACKSTNAPSSSHPPIQNTAVYLQVTSNSPSSYQEKCASFKITADVQDAPSFGNTFTASHAVSKRDRAIPTTTPLPHNEHSTPRHSSYGKTLMLPHNRLRLQYISMYVYS